MIAVDQDPLGRPGVPISSANGLWVLSKQLSGGGRAVLLFNATNTAATISTTATAAGLPRGRVYQMHNLWTNAVTQTGGAISAFVPGPRGRDVHGDRGGEAATAQAAAAHRAVARRRLAPGRRRRLDHRVRVVHERRRVRRQEAPPVAVGLARLAGQAARPGRRPAAQAGPAVHGHLSRHRAAVRSAARVLDLHRRWRRTTRSTAGARRWRGSASWSPRRCTRRSRRPT